MITEISGCKNRFTAFFEGKDNFCDELQVEIKRAMQ